MSKEEDIKDEEGSAEKKIAPQLSERALMASGIRIGTNVITKHMRQYIERTREDGLNIIDGNKIQSHIEIAGKFLARFDPKRVMLYSSREAAQVPIEKFSELTGVNYVLGRFLPGTLTNPQLPNYRDVDAVMVIDPAIDVQAIHEAIKTNIPVIAICDTNNVTSYVDLVIPANNRGRKALATLFWLLTRSYLIHQGTLSPQDPMKYTPEEFETKLIDEDNAEG